MKFDVGNLLEYGGEDLIFLTGAPGSRFSGLFYLLSQHKEINTSDWIDENTWGNKVLSFTGEEVSIGNHYGTYWGPGLKYGEKFNNLHALSKEEVLSEIMEPFKNWDGTKLLKSHHWAYNLDYVLALFPKSKIIMCYGDAIDCFYWWQKCGGFGITYPSYKWYRDDIRMLQQIKQENYHILSFCAQKRVDLKKWNLRKIFEELKLSINSIDPIKFVNMPNPQNIEDIDDIKFKDAPLIGIYTKGIHEDSFNHMKVANNKK